MGVLLIILFSVILTNFFVNKIIEIKKQEDIVYQDKIDEISNNLISNAIEFENKSHELIMNISQKQLELELMRMQANCNYQIFCTELDFYYKNVFISTADLKYGLYTICTYSDLSQCKEFMDKYEQYKNNLHKLKDVNYKI